MRWIPSEVFLLAPELNSTGMVLKVEFMGLSRRNLKGIAGGVAHQFNCSTSYYAYQVVTEKQAKAQIDLLTLNISPSLFNVERNRILAGMCQSTLLGAIAKWPDLELQKAKLDVNFDLASLDGKCIGITVVVALCDERGKLWIGRDSSYIVVDWRERSGKR